MSKEEKAASRRDFLKLAGVSAPAAVAVVATQGSEAAAAPAEPDGVRMADTAHTRAYYDTARF